MCDENVIGDAYKAFAKKMASETGIAPKQAQQVIHWLAGLSAPLSSAVDEAVWAWKDKVDAGDV